MKKFITFLLVIPVLLIMSCSSEVECSEVLDGTYTGSLSCSDEDTHTFKLTVFDFSNVELFFPEQGWRLQGEHSSDCSSIEVTPNLNSDFEFFELNSGTLNIVEGILTGELTLSGNLTCTFDFERQ